MENQTSNLSISTKEIWQQVNNVRQSQTVHEFPSMTPEELLEFKEGLDKYKDIYYLVTKSNNQKRLIIRHYNKSSRDTLIDSADDDFRNFRYTECIKKYKIIASQSLNVDEEVYRRLAISYTRIGKSNIGDIYFKILNEINKGKNFIRLTDERKQLIDKLQTLISNKIARIQALELKISEEKEALLSKATAEIQALLLESDETITDIAYYYDFTVEDVCLIAIDLIKSQSAENNTFIVKNLRKKVEVTKPKTETVRDALNKLGKNYALNRNRVKVK